MKEEKWRYRCPDGHTSWKQRVNRDFNRPAKSEYYCEACRKNGDDPHFEELRDMKAEAGAV